MDKLFDHKSAARRWYARWEESGLFTPDVGSSREPFVIILPPPNVTGILTVGHILGNSVQDLLIRWKKMQGFNTLWLPGFDHAGIATQKVVEDELAKQGKKRSDMTREEFLKRCWEWKEHHQRRITEQLKSLGCALDWTREAFTLDEKRSAAVRRVFVRLYEQGLIYRGDYTVNWCTLCGTAISDEEVEYQEKDSRLYWIKYPLEGGGQVTVATTRPETMLGDTAVGVSTRDAGKRGMAGKTAVLPFVNRRLPIIADEAVDPEFGSGFVKVTPAHDPNDFLFAKRHGLPFVVVIDRSGRMTEAAGEPFAGLDRFAARTKILEELEKLGLLEKVEPYTHSLGHHDRCKSVIEPLLSEEWFVRMEPLAKPAIDAVLGDDIQFYPLRWRNVYLSWMGNIRDWCVSRQLWWGHRIPVWYCPEGHMVVSEEDPAACTECGSADIRQDESVLDTWFSSWLWTFSPMGWPTETEDLKAFHPTTVLVTGFDIIFFWVARMIMASLAFRSEIPFKHVFLTGIVRDTKGRKMSKSLGNSPDPLDIIDTYGADAFRFTMAMLSPPGHDVYFSVEKVEVGRNFVNKIWQASRMIFGAYEQHKEQFHSGAASGDDRLSRSWRESFSGELSFEPVMLWEDRWMLHALEQCAQDVDEKLSGWRINEAATRLYDFFWHDFCDWYLELAKIRLYGGGDARTALGVLFFTLGSSLKLLHPFMPYVTEELWERLPMTGGLILGQPYPAADGRFHDSEAKADMDLFQGLVAAARNIRAQYNVDPGARIRLLIRTPGSAEPRIERFHDGLEQLVKTKDIEYGPSVGKEKGSASMPVAEYEVIIPLGGLADVEAEKMRLGKEKERIEAACAASANKLSNENFINKAKEEVVLKEREKQTLLHAELEKILESLRILGEM